jgi:acetyl esterase
MDKVAKDKELDISTTKISNVRVRIYRPKAVKTDPATPQQRLSCMIYIHGGAYVFGSLDSYDQYLVEFAKKLHMVVISIDYRMAPKHAYPIPTDDCYAVTKHIVTNPAEFGIDIQRLVMAGDSAGGNAVSVLMQRLSADKLPLPKLQVYI